MLFTSHFYFICAMIVCVVISLLYLFNFYDVLIFSFCLFCISVISVCTYALWLGSLTVTCQTCNPEVTQRRRFDSAPGHCRVTTLGKLFTHMCLCHQAV